VALNGALLVWVLTKFVFGVWEGGAPNFCFVDTNGVLGFPLASEGYSAGSLVDEAGVCSHFSMVVHKLNEEQEWWICRLMFPWHMWLAIGSG